GPLDGDRRGAYRVGEARLLVHLPHDLHHPPECRVVGVDHHINAVAEHGEIRAGDQHGDLDEHVTLEVEAGHLTVDPNEEIVHTDTLAIASQAGAARRSKAAGAARL